MKLDDWAMQFHILEINKILRPERRWPRLEELLAALEPMPRLSVGQYGSGIFIGWGSIASDWRYHHTICITSRYINGCRYGYHDEASYESIASMRDIRPVFNVGNIPETSAFIKALASIGIEATEKSPSLSPARLTKKPQ
jgi:hypothetical protein